MVIEDSSPRQYGPSFVDLALFLQARPTGPRPLSIVLQPMCACGCSVFQLEADAWEECARRSCPDCGAEAFLGESAALWPHASPAPIVCGCGESLFEVGVGFAARSPGEGGGLGEIGHLVMGHRCVACGELGVTVDSVIEDSPTDHLFLRI